MIPDVARAVGRAGIAMAASAALVASGLGFAAAASAKTVKPDYKAANCAHRSSTLMACDLYLRTNVRHRLQAAARPEAAPVGVGYGPNSLQSAYALTSASSADGTGMTVAVVDAYNDPKAAADLATYRSAWGLPACTAASGCFKQVNQTGGTALPPAAGTTGWDVEESLDVDMVSAICPNCHILLVEATSPTTANLGTAVNTAVTLGAVAVSNSYGGSESSSDPTFDTKYYKHAGVAITASAGDGDFGTGYPAASQFVTSVGGTSLSKVTTTRGWKEHVWNTTPGSEGTGSGCSTSEAKPSWQTDTACAKRMMNDIAADADPNTGLATYDTYSQGGWLEVGGTSASSPMIAAIFALAGTPTAGTFPSSHIYAHHTGNVYDTQSGNDGTCSPSLLCTSVKGFDDPTGWGTPKGIGAF